MLGGAAYRQAVVLFMWASHPQLTHTGPECGVLFGVRNSTMNIATCPTITDHFWTFWTRDLSNGRTSRHTKHILPPV